MYLIGLTGGIASGKSTVAARLAEHGAVVIDADVLSREAVAPGTEGLARIIEEFGDDVLTADGTLDRAALGARVFGHPELLARLNGIVHPEVRRLFQQRVADAAAAGPGTVVVYDVPLLTESGSRDGFDLVVVAHADAQTRAQRLTTLRGMSHEDAVARISAQAGDEERLAIADRVIDTGGSLGHTLAQADALWESVTAAPSGR